MSEYVRQSEAVIADAKKRLATINGSCADCKWRRGIDPYFWTCANPIVQLESLNQTNAYNAKRIQECNEQRGIDSYRGRVVCGPDGTLFEPGWSFWGWLFAPKIKIGPNP